MVLIGCVATLVGATVQAQVFTKNQVWKKNHSPAVIPANYYTASDPGPVPVGTPVHIVYAIQVVSNNTGASPVTVAITLPSGFSAMGVQCVRFANGTLTGAPLPGCVSSPFNIGALSGANDEVEIVIDGFFKQAGNFTALFNATRDATSEQTS
jgi:hypothetical protein